MPVLLTIQWIWPEILLAVLAAGSAGFWLLWTKLKQSNQELEQVKEQVLEWNRRLEGRIAKHTLEASEIHQKLENAYIQTVTCLIEAMSAKDTYLSSHAYNVAHYAVIIAEQIGYSKPQLARLYHGCVLHDLGKIAIPDNILLKEGRLTQHEYEVIKSHPYWGARILKPISSMRDIVTMVHQEHERWDGSGYPQGLQGDQICEGARIIAVADALDAMLSDRPYRQRTTLEKAVQEITACAGTQFDPRVAEGCVEAFRLGKLTISIDAHPHHYDPVEIAKENPLV